MHSRTSMLGFRSSLFIYLLLITVQLIEVHCKRSFIVVAPKVYDVGSKETIHVTVLDVDNPGTVTITLTNGTGTIFSEATQEFEKEGSKKIELEIPNDLENDGYRFNDYRLVVSGDFGDYQFNKNESAVIRRQQELTFINTDKPFYKAGQTVKLRCLIVNSDLRPLKETPIGSVWITNSQRVRLVQWMNITFENGLVHQELELPEEPVLGSWTIHLQVNKLYRTKYFTVKEYVLPTFEVKIIPPPYFLRKQENVTWNICAKYSYGKSVKGKLITELKSAVGYYHSNKIPTVRKEEEIDGCKEITRNSTEVFENNRYYGREGLSLFAEVIEDGTESKGNVTSIIYSSAHDFTIAREGSLQYFRAGIPFPLKISVRKPDSKPLEDKAMRVCAVMKRENWKTDRQLADNINECKNYKTNKDGEFIVTLPPQPPNTIDINVEVKSLDADQNNKPTQRFSLSPWYSSTGHHLQIQPLNSKAKCGSTVELSILYTSKESETRKIYYQVISKGDVVHDEILTYSFDPKDDLAGYSDETYLTAKSQSTCQEKEKWDSDFSYLNHIGKFSLKFDVNFKMSPKAHVILYSITEEGNVFADATTLEIEHCFQNPVEMKFFDERQFPGAKTTIQLSATPESICSVGVVDKSVFLLQESDILTKSKVYDQLTFLETSEYTTPYQKTSDYEYCSKKARLNDEIDSMEPLGFVDAITAFMKAGVMVISDLELETRPCRPSFVWSGRYGSRGCIEHGPSYVASFQPQNFGTTKLGSPGTPGIAPVSATRPLAGGGFSADGLSLDRTESAEVPLSTIRTYFPETWLWGIYFVGKDGQVFLKENIPDSITEWQGSSVCVHPDSGLGISEQASIIAFQPFFTSLKLPYSVIRGETVPVIVTVFNYLKECLAIRVHLDQTEDFELHNGTLFAKECVCGDKSITKRFFIKPRVLGTINITVSASTIKEEEVCENFDVADVSRSDSLTKPLIIEAEGFPKEETTNIFFCMEDTVDGTYKEELSILRREDVVEGSDRAFVSATGDVMGPTLEGLESLVRMPTGCGEQNMVTLVPNIVVLDYLKSTNRLKENIRQKGTKHIIEGYMRQQKYRHFDGSYSAFGKLDQSGSMWLTSFVLRYFPSIARYVDIDNNVLKLSRNWIFSRQQENGCFPVIGMVHNKQMKGGVAKEDKTPALLTAYVLTSLLISGEVNQTVIDKAQRCIQAKNNPSDYALAIFAYMASFTDEAAATTYLQELNKRAITEGFNRYWKNEDKSIAIEIASYAILASLKVIGGEFFQSIGPVARWLSLQRNAYGGFLSTQDTVMALEALAQYAVRINRQQLNMGVSVRGNDLDEIFQLDEGNELLMQRIRVPTLPTGIEVEAKGEGCALVQMVLRYNVPNTEASENFVLSIQSKRKEFNCKRAEVNICASLSKVQNESNMVVMELKMLSGFAVVRETVEDLLNIPELEIKRFEIKDNQLNIYFVQLTDQNKCFTFDVTEEIVVEDRKPAIAKIYDYYNQEEISTVSYSIDDECRI